MKKAYFYALTTLILIWMLCAHFIDNEVILPSISLTITGFLKIITAHDFMVVISHTIFRTISAIAISFLIALILSAFAFRYQKVKDFIQPIYVIFKTIPNITLIILGLIWLGRSGSVILIVCLVTLPIIYAQLLSAFENIESNIILNTDLYSDNYWLKLRLIYLPMIYPSIITSLKTTLSLGFKVTVMAELLSQIQKGIGREMYYAKINLETVDIFAWTIVIILISFIFDKILALIEKHLLKQ